VHGSGRALNVRYAVSEGFVVATRRTRTAGKVSMPPCPHGPMPLHSSACVWLVQPVSKDM
jgi:hypothetical protein